VLSPAWYCFCCCFAGPAQTPFVRGISLRRRFCVSIRSVGHAAFRSVRAPRPPADASFGRPTAPMTGASLADGAELWLYEVGAANVHRYHGRRTESRWTGRQRLSAAVGRWAGDYNRRPFLGHVSHVLVEPTNL